MQQSTLRHREERKKGKKQVLDRLHSETRTNQGLLQSVTHESWYTGLKKDPREVTCFVLVVTIDRIWDTGCSEGRAVKGRCDRPGWGSCVAVKPLLQVSSL